MCLTLLYLFSDFFKTRNLWTFSIYLHFHWEAIIYVEMDGGVGKGAVQHNVLHINEPKKKGNNIQCLESYVISSQDSEILHKHMFEELK